MAAVLAVVDVILEEHFLHLKEGLAREEGVRAGLVLRSNAGNLQLVGYLLQPALQVLAALHEVLDIVHVGEVEAESFEELPLGLWQVLCCQQVQEVSKVVSWRRGKKCIYLDLPKFYVQA